MCKVVIQMEYSLISQLPAFYSPVYIGNTERFVCYNGQVPLSTDEITSLHFHKCLEIGVCTAGSGNCIIDNRLYRYNKGDIQIVLPYQPHLANGDAKNRGRWIWFSYDPYKLTSNDDISNRIAKIIEKQVNFSGVFSPQEYPELSAIISKCIDETQNGKGLSQLYALLLVQQLILELSRIECDLKNNIVPRRRSFDKMLPALTHISENLSNSEELTLDVLANKCFISTATLRRYFYEFTDMSPQQFIAQARINHSQYLLSNTNKSITEISDAVGFESISCFTRAFKRHLGVSPSEYRK